MDVVSSVSCVCPDYVSDEKTEKCTINRIEKIIRGNVWALAMRVEKPFEVVRES